MKGLKTKERRLEGNEEAKDNVPSWQFIFPLLNQGFN